MTTTTRPRHARKEVRELADWLDDHGFVFDDVDNAGHTIWRWPATGATLKLPETPKGDRWKQVTRADALKIMGHAHEGKYRRKPHQPTKQHAGLVVTKAHVRWFLGELHAEVTRVQDSARRNGNTQAGSVAALIERLVTDRIA